jgi:hypothetical protein
LEQVIHRCLRKHPDQRFQTMKEVQVALGALKHESDSGMLYRTRAGMEPWPKEEKRSPLPLMTGIGAAAAVLAIAGGAWWWTHRTPKLQNAAQTPQNNVQPARPVVAQPSVVQPPPVAAEPPVTAPVAAPVPPVAAADQALTNDNIIQMVDAKVATAIILSQIRNSKTAFNLSSPEVIRLSQAHVSATIIEAMRNPKAAPPKPAAPPPSTSAAAASTTPAPSASSPASATAPAAPVTTATTPNPVSAPHSIVAVTLTDGMPFSIALAEDVPQGAEEGRRLRFTASSDVRVGDLVVIAKGAAVMGAIAQAERKGRLGIGGSKMTLRLIVVDAVDGHKYPVRAQSAKGAGDKNERQVEPAVKPKNKDLVAATGTEYIAYIDGDATVSVKK